MAATARPQSPPASFPPHHSPSSTAGPSSTMTIPGPGGSPGTSRRKRHASGNAATAQGGPSTSMASSSAAAIRAAAAFPRTATKQQYSFNSPQVLDLSHVRSSAIRMPDIAHRDALANRIPIPTQRGRGVLAYASSDDDDDDEDEQAGNASATSRPTLPLLARPVTGPPKPNTVADARHAPMFLAYIHEHDSSSADISLCNDVDYEPSPGWDFIYDDGYRPSPEIKKIDAKRAQEGSGWCEKETFEPGWDRRQPEDLQGTRRGCSCGDDDDDEGGGRECNPLTCECARLHAFVDETWQQEGGVGPSGISAAYDEDGRIKPAYVGFDSGLCIYECTDACGCGDDCPNRVVQNGRKVPLEIFKTEKCGWGVRARDFIKAGTFVTTYGGELLINDEAEYRGEVYERTVGTTYVLDLEPYCHEEVVARGMAKRTFPEMPSETEEEKEAQLKRWELTEEGRESYLSVDAGLVGNISRFFNHSCDPNLRQHYVYHSRNLDFARPHACFFTARDVAPREELRFSYAERPTPEEAERIKGVLGDSRRSTLVEGRTVYQRCHCGEAACVGVMFAETQTEGAALCAAAKQEEEEEQVEAAEKRGDGEDDGEDVSGENSRAVSTGASSIDRERDRVSASRSRATSAAVTAEEGDGDGDVTMEEGGSYEEGQGGGRSSRASTTSGPSRVVASAPGTGSSRRRASGRGRLAPKSASPDDWYVDMSGD